MTPMAMAVMAADMATRMEAMVAMEVDGVLAMVVELGARCVAAPGVLQGAVDGVAAAHTRVSSRTSQSCTNAVTCHAQILLWRVTYSSCDMTFVTFLVCTGKNLVWRLFVLFVQIFAPISAVSSKTPDLPQNHDPQMTSWRKGWTPTFVFIALISAATLFL